MEERHEDSADKPKRKKTDLSKEERLKLEKENLEAAIKDRRVDSVREKVAYILNNFPAARDSDKKLALVYWDWFQNEHFSPSMAENIFKLEHVPTLARERARIQNDFGLFQAAEKVKRRRAGLEVEKQEIYSPGEEISRRITVYADESGKSDAILCVGGVWFLDPGKYSDVWFALKEYKQRLKIKSEIKFSGLTKNNWKIVGGYLDEFFNHMGFTSFKIVYLKTKDLRRPIEDALYDLYRYFLLEGAEFEVSKGRVVLPRNIELMKDRDEGSDIINLKDMETKLLSDLQVKFKNQLHLVDVGTISSEGNHVMQAVDLIIGSFGRVANRKGEQSLNHKDEFANMVLGQLGVDLNTLSASEKHDWLQITPLE